MTMKENQNAASFDFESFTDKSVMECDLPELEVCYKDIDCQILKDICVDEGRPERDINVIESFNDEKPAGLLFTEPPNDKIHFEAAEDSSPDGTNNLSGSKEANDGEILVSEGKLGSSLDNSFDKVSTKHCDPENSEQIDVENCGATGKAETDSSEMDSLMVRTEDLNEQNNITQAPDQIRNGKTDLERPGASSAEVGGNTEDIRASSLVYNSNVESRIVTSNFDSPGPAIVDNGATASIEEHSAESADAAIIENVQEQLNIEDGNSDTGSATSSFQHVGNEDSSGEAAHEQSPESKDASSDDPVLISNSQSESPTDNVQAVEPRVPQHERNNSSASVVNALNRDEGEMSFSAASLVSYSGQIAFSGSLSHRSDGSTTSAKSFAFPVLQSEWNSSPVRMAKAESRRHFRKHKSWVSVILCCRF